MRRSYRRDENGRMWSNLFQTNEVTKIRLRRRKARDVPCSLKTMLVVHSDTSSAEIFDQENYCGGEGRD